MGCFPLTVIGEYTKLDKGNTFDLECPLTLTNHNFN